MKAQVGQYKFGRHRNHWGIWQYTMVSERGAMARLDKACEGLEVYDVCPSNQIWFEVGAALAKELGEDGRRYFHQLSCGYKDYDVDNINKTYSNIMKNADRYSYNAGTIFHYINKLKHI